MGLGTMSGPSDERKYDMSRGLLEAHMHMTSVEFGCPACHRVGCTCWGLSLPWAMYNGVVYWNGIPQGSAAGDDPPEDASRRTAENGVVGHGEPGGGL